MLRALIVAYHFPPLGGAGVQRALHLARYLPEFGVQPLVLTGPGVHPGQWTPDDPALLTELPDVSVIRASGPFPAPGLGAIDKMLGRLSAFSRWWVDSIVQFGQVRGERVAVVLSEMGPYETALGSRKLGRILGVPWVADLQDPWALDEMWLYPSAIQRFVDRSRMRSTLHAAAAVVMNTPEAAARLQNAFPEFRSRRVISIPNGFDAADFAAPVPERADRVFRIVHSGSLHTEFGLRHRQTRRLRRLLGGMPVPGVDFLSRSHIYLLEAVDALIRSEPELSGTIEVHLVGVATAADRAAAAPYPFVRFHGHKSHPEAISLLRAADLLFLPMHDLPKGVRAGLIPAKTYEYMASGRPILAAVPDGDARDLLHAVGTATVCRPADVGCLAEGLRERIDSWRDGALTPNPDPEVLEQSECRRMTERMSGLLREVVDIA